MKVITKEDFKEFIDALIAKHRVVAPISEDGVIQYGQVTSGNEIRLDLQSTLPAKEVLFPRCETLFAYEMRGNEIEIRTPEKEEEGLVLLGIPPCEAKGFTVFDAAFASGEFRDPYYSAKRENLVVIGRVCEIPRSTCFCTSVGGSPSDKEEVDLMLTDIGDKYVLEVVTQKGAKLLGGLHKFKDASDDDVIKAKKVGQAAENAVRPRFQPRRVSDTLEKVYEDPLWDEVHQKCIGCGVCSYLCPTCYCFDVLDERKGAKGKRVRIWDSCQFPLFTRQASGENPRPTGKERMRQRIMHKFEYHLKNHGEIACVGCGRCVQHCPVNLDIREILEMVEAR